MLLRRLRLVWLALASSLMLGGGALAACGESETGGIADADGGGGGIEAGRDTGNADSPAPEDKDSEAPADSGDAGIINGPGEAGAECSFNRECNAALRCECTESAGCACKVGVRGTGRNGIDPCTDGNACSSSVCVEGPPDSGSFCSDECKTSGDCTGKLPLCSNIAFVGRICIRTPPN